ncbi:MAG: 2-hydroxychromene-2-carboxylate isomerase [Actinomycetota bacterium]|nr:2-hydroxychromene-2-carboxylate isomerase [Actinomycetota bacterium]
MKTVEFYYDLVSPYSYLARREVSRICDELGAELSLKPMLLGAVHNAVGLQAPIEIRAKARYQAKDIRRWAEHYGLPIDFPDPFPFRTLKTMRAAMFLKDRGELEAFTREAFALYWEEGGAPKGLEEADEDGPVSEVARRIGTDPDEVLAGASAPEAKEALKAATGEAVERGVFGAPAFFVGDEMFWGNDRLHFVEGALRGG